MAPFGRKPQPRPLRVLTASAVKLDLANKSEARRLRAIAQGWQADAWNFRDAIGEISYAVRFKANAMARMRLFVGVEPEVGESDKPIPLEDSEDIPTQFSSVASKALMDLAGGEGQRRELLKKLSISVDIPGEARILGQTSKETGEETWTIRSTDEIEPRDDGWYMREIPDGPQGIIPWEKLEPELNVISRVWVPHPRFYLMADSPMKPLCSPCETLLILRRLVRAEGRSRLNRGILTVPDELSIKVPDDDNEDPEADPFFSGLVKALMEPIGDEGVASAYAPIAVRGPAEALKALQHIDLTKPFEEQEAKARQELVGDVATGLDVPREVVEGAADMNHWSMWQVDDNTFRHHLEPHAITLCDMLTAGYFRERLISQGVPPEYVRRLVIWYDPTELVTHPDQTKDALDLYDRHAISLAALRAKTGFSEEDAPGGVEILLRLLSNMRTPPANIVMAAVHAVDPTLTIPPIHTAGTVPGVNPTGVDPGQPPIGEEPPALLEAGPTVDASPEATAPEQPSQGPPPITASGSPESHRLSRKLAQIDRELRARLQTAANAAMLAQLSRIGGRLRTKVAKDETLRTKIAHRPNERVSAILGRDVVTASGVNAQELVGSDWAGLRDQYMGWTEAAQKQALQTAVRMGTLSSEDDAVKVAEAAQVLGREKGWEWLSQSLSTLGEDLLYNPDPNVGPGEWADLNPDTLVSTGTIRTALGIAGGGDTGTDAAGTAVTTLGQPVGQIGTGSTITNLLEAGGMETEEYEWNHGPSLHPFEPHLDLDGTQFASFESETLANTDGYPGNAYFFPGDHEGCSCFPAGTLVSGPDAVGASTRWYEGELVEIVTAAGHQLTGTPNHPILTPDGWVALGLLHEGSHVVSGGVSERVAALVDPDDHQAPARIEDVASALHCDSSMRAVCVPSTPVDFHGDGMHGDVDVVRVDRELQHGREAALGEHVDQPLLVGAVSGSALLSCERGASQRLDGVGASPLGSMGGACLGLPLGGCEGGRVENGRGFGTATLDACLDQSLADGAAIDMETLGDGILGLARKVGGDDLAFTEPGSLASCCGSTLGAETLSLGAATPEVTLNEDRLEGRGEDVESLRGAFAALASDVRLDRILSIGRRRWAGHVFNLQTRVGWYQANGIVVHNCDFMPLWVQAETTGQEAS